MADKIKIDFVSDVVCPWCIIGYKRLEKAIAEMGIEEQVELEWQPFELNPQMPQEGENVNEHIQRKYGTSSEDRKRSQANMIKLGEELNFKFDYFDDMRIVNTRDAHILLEYAKEHGKQTDLNLRLVTAFFSERKDISNREILIHELESIGLDGKAALKRLESEDAHEKLKTDETFWTSKGIRSVPSIVFNHKSALSGAQAIYVYKRVLSELIEKMKN